MLLFKIFLALHIAGGTTALLAGAAAMIAPKGKRAHSFAGQTYFWAMAAVCASAVVMCFLRPQQFLFYVAIFSFYLAFTGRRMTERKQLGDKAEVQDWTAAVLAALGGGALIVRGVWSLALGESFGWVNVVFGALCLGFSLRDMVSFVHPPQEKTYWFFTHLTRMLAAYIATFTAFAVVNVKFLPALAVWLLPTVVGSIGIAVWTRYYRQKFQFSHSIIPSTPLYKSEM
jgi:uncharacterized membrane protein